MNSTFPSSDEELGSIFSRRINARKRRVYNATAFSDQFKLRNYTSGTLSDVRYFEKGNVSSSNKGFFFLREKKKK